MQAKIYDLPSSFSKELFVVVNRPIKKLKVSEAQSNRFIF